jgi:hypothetical protein
MKYDFKICSGCGIEKPIVNKTKNLCLKCNRDRLNRQEINPKVPKRTLEKTSHENDTKVPLVKKRARIKPISETMKFGVAEYNRTKARKRKDMIKGGYFRCFFSNTKLDVDGVEEWHHALGRTGDLLWEYKNIFPAIRRYHRDYHDLPIEQLMKLTWYRDFVRRLKAKNHKVYNKELNRMLKAGIIDMDNFINEFK